MIYSEISVFKNHQWFKNRDLKNLYFSFPHKLIKASGMFLNGNWQYISEKLLSCMWLFVTSCYTVHGILQDRILEWVAFPFSRGFPNPGIEPGSPALQADSYQLSYQGSDQIWSVAQSCPTLCDPMNRSTPGLPVHQQLPEFTQSHVHRVSDAIQPSHPLSSPSPPALNPSQHRSLFQWVNSSHEVAKVLEFQL